ASNLPPTSKRGRSPKPTSSGRGESSHASTALRTSRSVTSAFGGIELGGGGEGGRGLDRQAAKFAKPEGFKLESNPLFSWHSWRLGGSNSSHSCQVPNSPRSSASVPAPFRTGNKATAPPKEPPAPCSASPSPIPKPCSPRCTGEGVNA
ncbi:MAG: hypothetical protein RLZZ245_1554, partial [Verrucomicrobiota bacterium]